MASIPELLLESLLARGREIEYIEYKDSNGDKMTLGKTVCALSNAASLADVEFGYLIYGVQDDTCTVVGTKFHPSTVRVGNEDLELWLNKQLDPDLNVQILEFEYRGMSVAIFKIPASVDRPNRFQGVSYVRIGSNIRELNDYPDRESEIWTKARDKVYEKRVAKTDLVVGEVLSLLDYAKYFSLTNTPLPANPEAILSALKEEDFVKQQDDGLYCITNLGATMIAHDLNSFPGLDRKIVRVIRYAGTDKMLTRRERANSRGYAVDFEELIAFINDQLPSNEELGRALRIERKMYPEIAIRELVANALIHQDLTTRGTSPTVEIFDDRIEISNPGKSLIDPERFLDHKPLSRNETLAAFMRRIGICEERGSGIDKVFRSVESYQLPSPRFEQSETYLTVTLFSYKDVKEMSREERVRACFQHACLLRVTNTVMTNATLRARFKLGDSASDSVFVSSIIGDTLKAGFIKPVDSLQAKRSSKYLPYWA